MAPKNKGKKGKKNDDDFWENAGETIGQDKPSLEANVDVDDEPITKREGGFSGFASFGMLEDAPAAEEEEDFGGLMSAIKASKSKKDKKKSKKGVDDVINGSVEVEDSAAADDSGAKEAIQVTADDLADEEWGPVKEKKKKDKKKKDKKVKAQLDEGEDQVDVDSKPSSTTLAEPVAAGDEAGEGEEAGEEGEGNGPRILTKKEKEKLKKEREKAKKKAQAAAKKGTEADAAPSPTAESIPAVADEQEQVQAQAERVDEAGEEKEADGDDATPGKSDAKKKKKKKAKKDEGSVAVTAPSAAASGKKKTGISALKALMEEKKRLEEEARKRAEEEKKRIEEEERRAEEEAKRKEEERQRRKEKEKAKREQAKKEGRLLTEKQRKEKQMAEIRKQALLASGVQIEGLQQQGDGSSAPKKVVYGSRKRKGPNAKDSAKNSPAQSRPETPIPDVTVALREDEKELEASSQPAAEAAKSDWENSSDEEGTTPQAPPGVKDSWDASSDEEDVMAVHTAKAEPPKPAAANAKTTPSKAGAETSSSEDESSDESDESGSETDSSEETSEEEMTAAQKIVAQRKAEAAARRAKAHEEALAARNKDDLRSPICCILGHVDTGKTKLLDKIRQTNVQEGEAGGITQQIGATYFPVDAIKQKTTVMNKNGTQEYKVPGLLIIDTPGHESFTNLRSRGSSLCNIAVLVVDIMHGLEAQTLESLRLLRERKTPFIVALNKIDRMYGWEATPDGAFQESLAKQTHSVQREFEDRVKRTILAFAEEGLNACLYYENKNFARNVSIVPTSAVTGEGIPDMIMLLVNLTQQRMSDRLMYLAEVECTVLEVKVVEGLGTTVDVVLSNGILREGERIVICGLNGPIVTQVRALLTPQPLRELRIKSAYVHHKEVKAALGVKIVASDLEKAIAGSRLLIVGPDDDEDDLRDEVMSDLTSLLNSIDKSGRGVCVQASTLGSLEALLDFLKVSKIPVSGINIGPVHKKDVMRSATMLEKAKELACILCFDVPIDKDAEKLAEEMGIRLFRADIIYHLFDAFTTYNKEITEAKRRDAAPQAVWPCRLKIINVFCKRDPIILGVDILDGSLRVGTPLAVVKTDPATGKKIIVDLGKITSLEINHKSHDLVKKSQAGGGVAVKIEHAVYQSAKMFGRHFDEKDDLISHISRQSIDVLKTTFKADVSIEEWLLIKALKPRFNIP
ncbi:hypothetical protein AX15_003372 [Amanita polypyramis BW_CC]|nr:hypothetical protein AX15_003372 [Amanita polypyramis BW_CC]